MNPPREREIPNPGGLPLRPLLGLLFVACLVLAFANRFVMDDAFISFRYAQNLVQGEGLVYNPGERVEGYTNFLWTLLLTVPFVLGLDPVLYAQALGLGCFAGSLLASYYLARLLFRDRWGALLVVLLLGTNYTFSSFATGGLETQLQAFLVVLGLLLAELFLAREERRVGPHVALSLVALAAFLTRMDSALPFLVIYARLLPPLVRGRHAPALAAAVLPGLLGTCAFLLWRWSYYGDWLPNTFYLKVRSGTSLSLGTRYLWDFFRSYWLLPLVLVLLGTTSRWIGRPGRSTLLALVLVWCAYLVYVGGGFMEFRLLVPVLPALFVLVVAGLRNLRRPRLAAALAAVVVAGSLSHSYRYHGQAIETVDDLAGHLEPGNEHWNGIGRRLGELFGGTDVVIATGAAGAIPFHSRLRVVDMLGLNDRWIARHGLHTGDRPGHQRMPTHAYLDQRGVNLVLSWPRLVPLDEGLKTRVLRFPEETIEAWLRDEHKIGEPDVGLLEVPPRLIEVPLDGERKFVMLYLRPNPAIERVIREQGLVTYELLAG